jgi:hypothetical protein
MESSEQDNDVELKGDVELDFNDEKSDPNHSEEKEIPQMQNTYEIGPSQSKTVPMKKGGPVELVKTV